MILHCSYEEARALRKGVSVVLAKSGEHGPVLAPSRERLGIEELSRRLDGDLSVTNLAELNGIVEALGAVTEGLRIQLDALIVATHPASEEAVDAYFDLAHALTALNRARELQGEMEALIELMTGSPVDEDSARSLIFPD